MGSLNIMLWSGSVIVLIFINFYYKLLNNATNYRRQLFYVSVG